MRGRHEVSIVIPCYCSGSWMEELVSGIGAAMRCFENWELILVNDDSPDNGVTWKAIRDASNSNENIIGIDLQANAGQFHASICGMEQSTGSIVVLMDDDLQHDPKFIPILIDALEEQEADCVMGSFEKKRHSIIRNFGSWIIRQTFSRLHGLPKGVRMSSYRAIRRSAVDMMIQHHTANPVLGALVLGSSRKVINVNVPHSARPYGKSGYRFSRLVKATLDNVFLASTLPLRVFSYLGVVTFVASLAAAGYFAYQYFTEGPGAAPGFTTIVLLELFLIGIVSMGLGLIGEYLDRVIDEVEKKPRWHVRETVGIEDSSDDGQ